MLLLPRTRRRMGLARVSRFAWGLLVLVVGSVALHVSGWHRITWLLGPVVVAQQIAGIALFASADRSGSVLHRSVPARRAAKLALLAVFFASFYWLIRHPR